jgi:hypothetical protein
MIPFKSIRVGIYDVKIEKLKGKEEDECLGLYKNECQTIYLLEKMSSERQEAVIFLHELFHAILSIQGIGGGKIQEEQAVDGLSTGLAMVIRDNQELMEWLKGKLS